MRIRITRGDLLVGQSVPLPGDVLDVADDVGRRLVLRGQATPAPDAEPGPAFVESADAGPRARKKG